MRGYDFGTEVNFDIQTHHEQLQTFNAHAYIYQHQGATQAYIDARKPLGTLINVAAATTVSIPVAGTVYLQAEQLAAAQTKIASNLAALSLDTPIGGRIYAAEIIEQVMSAPGVFNFVPLGLTDTILGVGQIPQIDASALAFVTV